MRDLVAVGGRYRLLTEFVACRKAAQTLSAWLAVEVHVVRRPNSELFMIAMSREDKAAFEAKYPEYSDEGERERREIEDEKFNEEQRALHYGQDD